jgi:hypothetical protein
VPRKMASHNAAMAVTALTAIRTIRGLARARATSSMMEVFMLALT